MIVSLDSDPRFSNVTFTWDESGSEGGVLDVLVRLIGLTDAAADDGELDPYLLDRGADGWWRGVLRLPSGLRTSYQLCPVRDTPLRGNPPDEERWATIMAAGVVDPANGATLAPSCTYGNPGAASILELADALPQPWHARRSGVPRGDVVRHVLGDREHESVVHVYTPPGYKPGDAPLPLVIVFDGRFWMPLGVSATFDNLIDAEVVGPFAAVVVESMRGTTRVLSLTFPDLFLRFLLDELMPFVSDNISVTDDPRRTVLAGQSLGGLAAAHTAFAAPDRFGAVIGQSSSFWWPGSEDGELGGDRVIRDYAASERQPIRFFMEAGLHERELLEQNRRMRDVLVGQGYDVAYREYEGGHDCACWRGGLADGLVALLGADGMDAPATPG